LTERLYSIQQPPHVRTILGLLEQVFVAPKKTEKIVFILRKCCANTCTYLSI